MSKRKLAVVTGTRAEFGLLNHLIKEINEDQDLELQLIVTGMHLSPEFGLTYKDIESEGFIISKKIEILLSSDTPVGISKSIGLGVISFSEALEQLNPDILVVLGDRFEILSAVIAANIARIPIAHIHGGELTFGAIDEAIRHSITKMAHLHFTSTESYRKRVIQLGENPEKVYNTGTPGIDNILNMPLLSRKEFEKSINFPLSKGNFLVTFHPVTLEKSTSEEQFKNLLKALEEYDAHIIFTKPNADTDGRILIQLIDNFVKKYPQRSVAFTSLGQLRYLSALQHVNVVIGNSSSGLIEAPSFKVATINIGDRQKGRIRAKNVIDCIPEYTEIKKTLNKALSSDFQRSLENVINPYGKSGASLKIKEILKNAPLDIVKKEFFDIDFSL